MITKSKRYQDLWHEYEKHLGKPGTLRDAIEWGLAHGKLSLPRIDPRSVLVDELKSALRSETRTDDHGNEYRANAAITFTSNGIQESLWGDVDRSTTPHEFMVEHFAQRRKGIVDDCAQLKADVDHYNGAHRDRDSVQLILNFEEDVAEREALRALRRDAAE